MKLEAVDPSRLVLDANLRPGDWRVNDMVQDLLVAGRQIQPIGVEPDYRVVFGFRRAAALQLITRERMVPAEHPLTQAHCIVLDPVEGKDRVQLQLLENTARLNYSPVEEAQILEHLRQAGYKLESAARLFRRTKGWACQRLALLKLPPDVQAMIPDSISAYEGYILAQMPVAQMRRRVNAMLEAKPTRHDLAKVRRRNLVMELEQRPVPIHIRPVIEALIRLLKGKADLDEFLGTLPSASRGNGS